MVDKITTFLGILLIPYSAFLLYKLDKFGAMDFMVVAITGMFLIWFKGDSAKDVIGHILNSKFKIDEKAAGSSN